MFALDLFNTRYERQLQEGGVDNLEARRIDDLNMKMQDLLARAKEPAYKKNPGALAGLKRELEKICPQCESIVHVARYQCPECEFEWPPAEVVIAECLPHLQVVEFGKPIRTTHTVARMDCQRHEKQGKIPSMRVTYYADTSYIDRIASEWIFFEHKGLARSKAIMWWKELCVAPELGIPSTVDEALQHSRYIATPVGIVTEPDGKYTRIVERILDEIPF
jgi:DNA repair protein RadD